MKIKQEYIIALVCFVLGTGLIYLSRDFPELIARNEPGPSFFPYLIGIFFVFTGVGEIYVGRKNENYVNLNIFLIKESKGVFNIVVVGISIVIYILLMPYIGFIELTFVFLMFVLLLLKTPLLQSILFSTVTVVIIYYLFGTAFRVPLPGGIIF